MRRRIFAGFLALAMMLTVIPATDVHAETVSGNQIEQTVSGNSVEQEEKEVEETKEVKDENVNLSQVPATMSVEDVPVAQADGVIDTADELETELKKGGTVTLGGNIQVNKQIDIPKGVKVTLDLGGYAISSGKQSSDGEKHIYPLSNNGNLTIMDSDGKGSITGRGIYNQDGAKLTINAAKIVAEDYNGGACVWSYSTGEVYLNNATMIGHTGVVYSEGYLEINGGTYTCYSGIKENGEQIASPTYNIRAYNGLKITDGTFTSRHGVISVGGGKAVIEDGRYTINFAAGTTSNVVYVYGNADLTISDGEFISDDSANTADSGAAVLVSGTDAKLIINNGTYVGMNGMVSGNSNTVIHAGDFSTVWDYNHYGDLNEFVAAESEINAKADGNGFVVKPISYVAEVAGTKYKTLEKAVAAANGGTVNILTDIVLTDDVNITEGMNVTIEGAGKTITGANGKDVFYVEGGKLTLEEGLNVHAPTDCVIYIRGGEVVTAANLTKAGTSYSVIQGNGQYSGNVTITGGVVTNQIPDECAIYWPQEGKLTITGGTITGGTGIRLSSGSMEITGGTINANGTAQSYVASDGGSVVDTGDAVMIENIGGESGYEAITSVSITGGTFTSANAKAVASYTAGNEGVNAVTGFITGGTFSSDLDTCIANGYEAVQSGDNYIVGEHNPVLVAEVASTCTATGTKAHYKCDLCGRLYLNAADTTPVTETDLVTPKMLHSYSETTGECKYGCGSKIIVAGEVDVLIEPEETEHKVSEDIPEDVKAVATEIASSVTTSTESLTKAVEEVAETYTKDEALIEEAKAALGADDAEDVTIVVKPHLETEIKMIETEEMAEEKPLIVVEISLVYDVVAKKADGSAEEHLKEVKVTDPGRALEMSFEVSEQIAEMLQEVIASGQKIYMRHPKANGDVYFHEAKLNGTTVSFTNDAGFSEFTLMYGEVVPANIVKSGSGSPSKTIATNVETGEYIATGSVSKETIEDGKDELRSLIGDSYGLYKLALAVELKGELSGSTKVKILADDVTKADSIIILQKTEDGWKAVSATAGDGYVIGKFTSLSETLIFVNPDGEIEAAQAGNVTTVTPAGASTPAATGDSANVLGYAVTILAAAAALVVLYFRKRRA